MEKSLLDFGLTLTETKVYLALLKNGNSLAGKITKETGLHRRTVYDAIERLIEKGLVSYISENNKKHFEAVNPERLFDILKEREESLQSSVLELIKLHNSAKKKNETLFFRGKQSLKPIFEDLLKEKEILIIANKKCLDSLYFSRFNMQRKGKIKLLSELNIKLKNSESKKLKLENSEISIFIYNESVSLIAWTENPIAILIKQKEFSDSFKIYFNFLWNIAKF